MNKILLIIACLPLFACAQETAKFEFQTIDSAQGSKSELYTYAKSWLANTFVSSKAVIEMEDKEAGKIVGHGNFEKRVNSPFGNQVGRDIIDFTMTLDVKDNKYRFILSDYTHKRDGSSGCTGGSLDKEKSGCGGMFMTKKQWEKIKEYSKEESLALLENFKKAMAEGKSRSNF